MKKVVGIVLLCVFALSFIGGISVASEKPKPFCMKECIDGVAYVCCPLGNSGQWRCYWDGPCNI